MLEYLESRTFEVLLNEMLASVPNNVAKEEGEVIYDALAPTALKLAETYNDMAVLYRRTFAATADGDDLEKRVNEFGVERKGAGKAVRKAIFTDRNGQPLDVAISSLYRLGEITYKVIDQIDTGEFKVEAQTEGSVGNKDFGTLLPVEANNNLGTATLADVLIPGEDVESDESLYAKYQDHISAKAFGGNRAEYRKKLKEIQGVGGVRLKRAPNGGGTVAATIIDSDHNAPTPEFVSYVQNIIDPIEQTGEGMGEAPMCHSVTVYGVDVASFIIECELTLNGVTIGQVESLVTETINTYFSELRKNWENELPIIVRTTQIESRLLDISGIIDISLTLLNGNPSNITLIDEIPVLSEVVLREVV